MTKTISILSTVLFCLTACQAPKETSGPKKGSHEADVSRLVWGTQQEPDSLNPILSDMFATTQLSNLVHGYFVRVNNKMELVPDLIEEIPTLANSGISKDFLTYTYHLRKDATWHDGKPVTSRDVKFTFDLIMNPKVNVVTRDGYDKVASVETPDERTVVFHLKEVFAPFILTFNTYPILPAHYFEGKAPEEINTDHYNRDPIGAGPFRVKSWESGSYMAFSPYEHYFKGRPKLDEIDVKFIPQEQVLMVQMQTGEIQYYDSANTGQYAELRKIPGVKVYTTPANTWEHIDLNVKNPILADKRVRQAIMHAIDKDQIAKKVYQGLWKPAYSDQSPLSWAYNTDNESKLIYDLDKAKALLEEAAWKDEDGNGIREKEGKPLALTISTTTGRATRERTEQVLEEQLRAAGIDLTIKNYNATLFFGTYAEGGILKTGKYDLGMFAWLAQVDPDDYSLFAADQLPPNGQNSTFWQDERCTELLQRGRKVVDREKRKAIYREVQAILADEVPMIPLLYWVNIDAASERLKNFKPNPTSQGNTWNAWEWEMAPKKAGS